MCILSKYICKCQIEILNKSNSVFFIRFPIKFGKIVNSIKLFHNTSQKKITGKCQKSGKALFMFDRITVIRENCIVEKPCCETPRPCYSFFLYPERTLS